MQRGWGDRGTAGAAIPMAIQLDDVRMAFGSIEALAGITLSIRPREIVCVLGQSGCGKTTLLRTIAGIERPTSGTIRLDALEVSGPRGFVPPEERGVGLMFQDYALFPHLSVLDNVAFGLRRVPRAEALNTAERLLRRVGLGHRVAAFPHTLSGGEQQRVALARAIAPRPGLLLMDEPFANLDRRLRDVVRDETLALVRETGATVLLVTHDPEEAMRIADRVILMQHGRVVQDGVPEDLYRAPGNLFAARFFCEFNEIGGVAQGGAVSTALGTFAAPNLPEGSAATVCIRPQGFDLVPEGEGARGRIAARRLLGEIELIQIAVEGLDAPVQARVPAGRGGPLLKPGTDIGVIVRPEEVLVFAASDA